MSRRIILTAPGFLGDEIVFTGVIREIKRQFPDLSIQVVSTRPDVWSYNPYIEGVLSSPPPHEIEGVEYFSHHYCPSFRAAKETPLHYLQQYVNDICQVLQLPTGWPIRFFGGDLHLTKEERERRIIDLPRYWIIVAGWKTNVPTKGWGVKKYQDVVEAFRGRLAFVQIGHKDEWHQPLNGIINMIGKTSSLRDLFCLINQAEGVLCPITSIMHISAALPPKVNRQCGPFDVRPCVILGGGRESPHFIQYPGHHIMHTIGLLPCCASGGCGKSGMGKGQCEYPTHTGEHSFVPKCFSLIQPRDVVQQIEFFYRGNGKLDRQVGRAYAILDFLKKVYPNENAPRGAEIGVYKGETSCQLLLGHLGLTLYMVDKWARDPENQSDPDWYSRPQKFFDESRETAEKVTEFAGDRKFIMLMTSELAASKFNRECLHFVFIDADHSYEECKKDIKLWVDKIKPGGFLCGHDYNRPDYPREGVKRAVDEFLEDNPHLRLVLGMDNTWFIHMADQPVATQGPEFVW